MLGLGVPGKIYGCLGLFGVAGIRSFSTPASHRGYPRDFDPGMPAFATHQPSINPKDTPGKEGSGVRKWGNKTSYSTKKYQPRMTIYGDRKSPETWDCGTPSKWRFHDLYTSEFLHGTCPHGGLFRSFSFLNG